MGELAQVAADINKKWGTTIVTQGVPCLPKFDRIPFSSPRANYMTYGGIPRGTLSEFFGEYSGGKTSSTLDLCKNALILFDAEFKDETEALLKKKPKWLKVEEERYNYLIERGPQQIVFVDVELSLKDDWAETLGVDTDRVMFIRPEHQAAEDLFQMMDDMMTTGEVGLCVLDSIGALLSRKELEATYDDATYAGISKPLTRFSKRIAQLCNRHNATFLAINQTRDKINSPYGGTDTPGGKAWKFYCTTRLGFQRGEFVDEERNGLKMSDETPAGNKVMISVVKAKGFPPNRKAGFYTLDYIDGIDYISDMADLAEKLEIIEKRGAWFRFLNEDGTYFTVPGEKDELKIQSRKNLIAYLKEHPEMYEELEKRTKPYITGELR
jgi:recombination protein RecA